MPGQQVGVETGLRHRTGQHAVDLLRVNRRTGQHLATDLDAQINGRNLRQRAAQIDPRRTHRLDNRHVAERRILPAHAGDPALSLEGS